MESKDEMTLVEVVAGLRITLNKMESVFEEWSPTTSPQADGPREQPVANPIKGAIEDIQRIDKRIGDFAERLRQEVYLPVSGTAERPRL